MKLGEVGKFRNPAGGGTSFSITDLGALWQFFLGFVIMAILAAVALPFGSRLAGRVTGLTSRIPGGAASAASAPSDGFVEFM